MKNQETPVGGSLMLVAFKKVLVSMFFTAIALFILALFATYSNMSEKIVSACVAAATFICVFASGFTASGATGKNGWLTGLIAGIIYVIIMLIIGWITLGDSSVSNETLKMFGISILSGTVGGIAGVNFKRKKRRN